MVKKILSVDHTIALNRIYLTLDCGSVIANLDTDSQALIQRYNRGSLNTAETRLLQDGLSKYFVSCKVIVDTQRILPLLKLKHAYSLPSTRFSDFFQKLVAHNKKRCEFIWLTTATVRREVSAENRVIQRKINTINADYESKKNAHTRQLDDAYKLRLNRVNCLDEKLNKKLDAYAAENYTPPHPYVSYETWRTVTRTRRVPGTSIYPMQSYTDRDEHRTAIVTPSYMEEYEVQEKYTDMRELTDSEYEDDVSWSKRQCHQTARKTIFKNEADIIDTEKRVIKNEKSESLQIYLNENSKRAPELHDFTVEVDKRMNDKLTQWDRDETQKMNAWFKQSIRLCEIEIFAHEWPKTVKKTLHNNKRLLTQPDVRMLDSMSYPDSVPAFKFTPIHTPKIESEEDALRFIMSFTTTKHPQRTWTPLPYVYGKTMLDLPWFEDTEHDFSPHYLKVIKHQPRLNDLILSLIMKFKLERRLPNSLLETIDTTILPIKIGTDDVATLAEMTTLNLDGSVYLYKNSQTTVKDEDKKAFKKELKDRFGKIGDVFFKTTHMIVILQKLADRNCWADCFKLLSCYSQAKNISQKPEKKSEKFDRIRELVKEHSKAEALTEILNYF